VKATSVFAGGVAMAVASACTHAAVDKAEVSRLVDERLAERGLMPLPNAEPPGVGPKSAAAAPAHRGFDPCDPTAFFSWRSQTGTTTTALPSGPDVPLVCELVTGWTSNGPDPIEAPACTHVINSCKSAGYYQGGFPVGWGLYFDCVTPLLLGQTFPEVAVGGQTAAACMDAHRHPPPTGHAPPTSPAPPTSRVPDRRQVNPCDPAYSGNPAMRPICERVTHWMQRGIDETSPSACSQIVKACKAEGYYQGGSVERRGLYFDCVTPFLLGDSLSEVKVDPSAAAACLKEPSPAARGN
jgi:hypothetical protein